MSQMLELLRATLEREDWNWFVSPSITHVFVFSIWSKRI